LALITVLIVASPVPLFMLKLTKVDRSRRKRVAS
jgi:hypothetical protein